MKYLVQLIIWSFLEDIIIDLIDYFFKFDVYLIYLLFSFLGNIFFSSIAYLCQKKYGKRKSSTKSKNFMSIQLITNDKIQRYDSKSKIYFLIFIAGFFSSLIILYI